MRTSLSLLLIGLTAASACKKESQTDERWLESSQRKEVIVFKDENPTVANGQERSFYFQARDLPPISSVVSPSGIYFYSLEKDSLLLKTSQQKVYFKMSDDGQSFTIGRFFPNYTGLQDLLIFERQ